MSWSRRLVVAACGFLLAACPAQPPTKVERALPPSDASPATPEGSTVAPITPLPVGHRTDAGLRKSAPDAGQPEPQREWTAQPPGSTVLVFRELQIGMLPARGRRTMWSLITSGVSILVRVEEQLSPESIAHLDRMSIHAESWSPPTRSEYAGTATAKSPPFTLELERTFGAHEPKKLVLSCAAKSIQVHPAFATLVEGWKNNDESMEPAAWAPPRTERVQALNCKPPGGAASFSDGLSFVRGKPETAKDLEVSGVEWAFVNSDMVIQEGGYRWLPTFSLQRAP